MTFDNYIFDLYGTLIDIHTDEEQAGLWQDMAAYLQYQFEADYTAKELRKRYLEICAQEEEALSFYLAIIPSRHSAPPLMLKISA